jgi:hypothetical protein
MEDGEKAEAGCEALLSSATCVCIDRGGSLDSSVGGSRESYCYRFQKKLAMEEKV